MTDLLSPFTKLRRLFPNEPGRLLGQHIGLPGNPSSGEGSDPLRSALLDSRQRWQDLVSLAADLAFETDAAGRFVFLSPDTVLGWPVASLLGQSAELLLIEPGLEGGSTAAFNPFRPAAAIRRQRVWLKRADKSVACLSFTAEPLFDEQGRIIGARGVGIDMSDQDAEDAQMAASLRRCEVIDHILWLMRREVLAPRMMQAVLKALENALGAEGAAVLDILAGDAQSPNLGGAGRGLVLYRSNDDAGELEVGTTATHMMQIHRIQGTAISDPSDPAMQAGSPATSQDFSADGRPVLTCTCQTRFGEHAGLVLWRARGARAWDAEDCQLVASAASIVRVVLEHEAIQREMARQARTDPLTGLLNRRAFLEEMGRHIDRLDREGAAGTLMFIDLDNFKLLNDRFGHEFGDKALCATAARLRDAVRPSDLVARLGGDAFALWLNGADHLTAAERAERLRVDGPRKLREITYAPLLEGLPNGEGIDITTTMSIGIATRRAGGAEAIDSLMRRADLAMYEVKRAGRGHWRVSLEDPTG